MKRVVIDGRMVGPNPHGFSRYVSALAHGLAERKRDYEVIFLSSKSAPRQAFGPLERVELESRFLSPSEWIEIPRILKKLGASLYHSPTFASLPYSPCPWIVTIHDLNHLTFGDLKEKLYYQTLLKSFAKRARAVVSVSEFSRKEISRWLKISEERIHLAYNAIDPARLTRPADLRERLRMRGLKEGGYFYCLSNPKPHKNVPILVAGYQGYRARTRDPLPLVISFGSGEPEPGVIRLAGLDDSDVYALVHGARALVSPSLYEGFGLPPVEAAAAGIHVIASRIAPHLEGLADVQAGEVTWVDVPQRGASWQAALEAVHSGEIRGPSPETQSRITARFSDSRLGEDMDRIYQRVLGQGV